MSNDTRKFNMLHIQSDSSLRDDQVLLGAAYVCRNDKNNPLEIIAMLGITDDLQTLRRSRRLKKSTTTFEV